MMRTTLTLEDDLAGLLKQRAREFGIPFNEAVNRAICAGIGAATPTRRHPAPKTISHPLGSNRVSISTSSDSSPMSWEWRISRKKSMILPDVNVLVHAHNAGLVPREFDEATCWPKLGRGRDDGRQRD
jgi:hypothetical protein